MTHPNNCYIIIVSIYKNIAQERSKRENPIFKPIKKGGVFVYDYSITDIKSQEILPRLAERMQNKEQLIPYITKIYKKEKKENELLTEIINNRINNFKNCGTNIFVDENEHITGANFCKQRLCPVCNYRKSTLMWHKIHEIIKYFDNKYVFITLTVRNCKAEELSKTIDMLLESFHRIVNRRTWKKNFIGYVRGLEITYNSKENTFHPHIHILTMVTKDYFKKEYVDINEIRKWWTSSAKLDYFVQVNIEKVKNKEKAVAEVAKYAVKMSSVLENGISSKTLKATETIYQAIKSRRLIAVGGTIAKKAKELKIKLEDDEEIQATDKTAKFYEWNKTHYEKKDL